MGMFTPTGSNYTRKHNDKSTNNRGSYTWDGETTIDVVLSCCPTLPPLPLRALPLKPLPLPRLTAPPLVFAGVMGVAILFPWGGTEVRGVWNTSGEEGVIGIACCFFFPLPRPAIDSFRRSRPAAPPPLFPLPRRALRSAFRLLKSKYIMGKAKCCNYINYLSALSLLPGLPALLTLPCLPLPGVDTPRPLPGTTPRRSLTPVIGFEGVACCFAGVFCNVFLAFCLRR